LVEEETEKKDEQQSSLVSRESREGAFATSGIDQGSKTFREILVDKERRREKVQDGREVKATEAKKVLDPQRT